MNKKRKPFQYLIFDWMIETDQNPKQMIDACFGDYVNWFCREYPGQLAGVSRTVLEKWWDDEVGLTKWSEERGYSAQ